MIEKSNLLFVFRKFVRKLERFLLLDGWSALLLERFLLCGDGEIFGQG